MEIIFIRHGHGEHLIDYPNQLNTLHPSLTAYGKHQVLQLCEKNLITTDDLVIVSPTKRTIETAFLLLNGYAFVISPFVGPRMFPQNKELSSLKCDFILSKSEIKSLYGDLEVIDFNIDCWGEGINTINQEEFDDYANQLLSWIKKTEAKKTVIISHDGTITNYRILLGEKGLTREDFLGEAGVYQITYSE